MVRPHGDRSRRVSDEVLVDATPTPSSGWSTQYPRCRTIATSPTGVKRVAESVRAARLRWAGAFVDRARPGLPVPAGDPHSVRRLLNRIEERLAASG